MHIQKTHTLATKLQWVISAGRWVFQHLEASLISSAWGEFWAVNKLLFQSFAVNISYSTGGDWRMKNSKCGSHHPYQPTQSGMWAGMRPAPLGSVLPKALAISIQNMLLVHNTHTHTPSCMHTHTHTITLPPGQTGPATRCKYTISQIESRQNWQIKIYSPLKMPKIYHDRANWMRFPSLNECCTRIFLPEGS